MSFKNHPLVTRFNAWANRVFRFDPPHTPRRLLALLLAIFIAWWAVAHFGRVDYAWEHLAAFMCFMLLGYVLSTSWRLSATLLVPFSLANEFIVDMLKPEHPPRPDWDQLAGDFAGIVMAVLILIALRRLLPTRTGSRSPG